MSQNKQPVNSLCNCQSGLKFKKCCRLKIGVPYEPSSQLGNWSRFVRVVSSDQEKSGTTIHNITIREGAKARALLEGPVIVEVNSIDGFTSGTSAALIALPVDGGAAGKISTTGNATVKTDQVQREIGLLPGQKKLKIESSNGLYAIARVKMQADTGIGYFDIYIGLKGTIEQKTGPKEIYHAHVSILPDGNGKFVRLSGYECEIDTDMILNKGSGEIHANICYIKLENYSEKLVLKFETDSNNVVILNQIWFESA